MSKLKWQPHALVGRGRGRLPFVALLVAFLLLGTGGVAVPTYFNTITPTGIVIHHSAVPMIMNGSTLDVRLLDEIHRQRGYRIFYWGRTYHVGYHYIILPDGTVQQGRPERCRGAHARGYNDYIGICLIGDFSTSADPRADYGPSEPTEAQMHSLIELCQRLRQRYGIPLQRIIRHSDVNTDTECPGERFPFQRFINCLNK